MNVFILGYGGNSPYILTLLPSEQFSREDWVGEGDGSIVLTVNFGDDSCIQLTNTCVSEKRAVTTVHLHQSVSDRTSISFN